MIFITTVAKSRHAENTAVSRTVDLVPLVDGEVVVASDGDDCR